MRKEKLEELAHYQEDYRIINEEEVVEEKKTPFLTTTSRRYLLANGKTLVREKLWKKGMNGDAVIIVPVTLDGEMVMTIEPRVHTKEGVGIGFPAGYIEKGETPIIAAKRELQEETGYQGREFTLLGGCYQDEGCSSAYNSIVLAEGCLRVSEQMLDKDEFVHYFICRVDEAYEMLDNGIIKGANSQLALEKAKQYLKV